MGTCAVYWLEAESSGLLYDKYDCSFSVTNPFNVSCTFDTQNATNKPYMQGQCREFSAVLRFICFLVINFLFPTRDFDRSFPRYANRSRWKELARVLV